MLLEVFDLQMSSSWWCNIFSIIKVLRKQNNGNLRAIQTTTFFARHIVMIKVLSWLTFSNCVPHQKASDSTDPISEFTFGEVHGYVDHIIPITGMTWNSIDILLYSTWKERQNIITSLLFDQTRIKNINKPVCEYQLSFQGIHTMLQQLILPHRLP